MNIQPISNTSFCGTLRMDRVSVAREIDKANGTQGYEHEQVESIIGNINTLKRRIEEQTPVGKEYSLDFEIKYSPYGSGLYASGVHSIMYVTVEDLKTEKTYTSMTYLDKDEGGGIDGEAIWQHGFKRITERILHDAKTQEEKELSRCGTKVRDIFDRLA